MTTVCIQGRGDSRYSSVLTLFRTLGFLTDASDAVDSAVEVASQSTKCVVIQYEEVVAIPAVAAAKRPPLANPPALANRRSVDAAKNDAIVVCGGWWVSVILKSSPSRQELGCAHHCAKRRCDHPPCMVMSTKGPGRYALRCLLSFTRQSVSNKSSQSSC